MSSDNGLGKRESMCSLSDVGICASSLAEACVGKRRMSSTCFSGERRKNMPSAIDVTIAISSGVGGRPRTSLTSSFGSSQRAMTSAISSSVIVPQYRGGLRPMRAGRWGRQPLSGWRPSPPTLSPDLSRVGGHAPLHHVPTQGIADGIAPEPSDSAFAVAKQAAEDADDSHISVNRFGESCPYIRVACGGHRRRQKRSASWAVTPRIGCPLAPRP